MAFNKAADLPDVWGLGEDVIITVTALDNEGQALVDAEIVVTVAGEEPVTLVSGDDGACTLHWTSSEPGEHTVSAKFAGDEDHLPAAGLRDFRVVDFRVEIVRLYNSFLDWIRASTGNPLDRETPREVELMLVSSSLPVSQKSLDEVISRFEEADYSEHPIAPPALRGDVSRLARSGEGVEGGQRRPRPQTAADSPALGSGYSCHIPVALDIEQPALHLDRC